MFHTLIIVGNVGSEPELKYLPSGQAVTKFSVASNKAYTDENGKKVKETIWFRVNVWGKQAEAVAQYLNKGNRVLIEGNLIPDQQTGNPRVWTKSDGTTAANFDVNAKTVRFLTPKESEDSTPFSD